MDDDEIIRAAGERMILTEPLPPLHQHPLMQPPSPEQLHAKEDQPAPSSQELEEAFFSFHSCNHVAEDRQIDWAGVVVQGWSNAPGVVLPPEVLKVTTGRERPFYYHPRISLGFQPSGGPPASGVTGFPRGPEVARGTISADSIDGSVQVGDRPLRSSPSLFFAVNDVVKIDFTWIGGIVNGGSERDITFAIRRNDVITLRCDVPKSIWTLNNGHAAASVHGILELMENNERLDPQPFEVCGSLTFGNQAVSSGRWTLHNESLSVAGYNSGTHERSSSTVRFPGFLTNDDPVFTFRAKPSTSYLVRFRENCEVRVVGPSAKTARVELNSSPQLVV